MQRVHRARAAISKMRCRPRAVGLGGSEPFKFLPWTDPVTEVDLSEATDAALL